MIIRTKKTTFECSGSLPIKEKLDFLLNIAKTVEEEPEVIDILVRNDYTSSRTGKGRTLTKVRPLRITKNYTSSIT